MPFDDDSDLGILRADFEEHRDSLYKSLEHKGYKIVNGYKNPNGDIIPQIYFKNDSSRPHLDFFLFEPNGPGKYRPSSGIWNQKKSQGFWILLT